jgi:hypothetical protein
LNIHVPSLPRNTERYDKDPLGFWSWHEGLHWLPPLVFKSNPDAKVALSRIEIHEATCHLAGGDETLEIARGMRPSEAASAAPTLEPGGSAAWTVRITGLPSNEYELVAAVEKFLDVRDRLEVQSNSLLLDVLQSRPGDLDGVTVDLAVPDDAANEKRETRAKVTFTNPGDVTRILYLPSVKDAVNLNDFVMCFDADGRRILSAPTEDFTHQRTLIPPNKSHSVEVTLLSKTHRARLAWFAGTYSIKDKMTDGKRVPAGYFLSPHITLAQ